MVKALQFIETSVACAAGPSMYRLNQQKFPLKIIFFNQMKFPMTKATQNSTSPTPKV